MKRTKEELAEAFKLEEFPRSAKYDPGWVIENLMGPNVLWLTESLSQVMQLEPGMRVLNMGCGRAISSIFLVKEVDVQVWATDLWIKPRENAGRIRDLMWKTASFPSAPRPRDGGRGIPALLGLHGPIEYIYCCVDVPVHFQPASRAPEHPACCLKRKCYRRVLRCLRIRVTLRVV